MQFLSRATNTQNTLRRQERRRENLKNIFEKSVDAHCAWPSVGVIEGYTAETGFTKNIFLVPVRKHRRHSRDLRRTDPTFAADTHDAKRQYLMRNVPEQPFISCTHILNLSTMVCARTHRPVKQQHDQDRSREKNAAEKWITHHAYP